MKQLYITLFLMAYCAAGYGQFKLGLSVQYEQPLENYHELVTFSSFFPVAPPERQEGYTITAHTIWTLTPYLSVNTGLGYSQKDFEVDQSLPLFALRTEEDGFIVDPVLTLHRFSNLEIPVGFRFNTPQYKRFEIGVSASVITAFTMAELQKYESSIGEIIFIDPIPTMEEANHRNNTWRYYGHRLDLGLDFTYQVAKQWEVFTAFYWAMYDFRNKNFIDIDAGEGGIELIPRAIVKGGQNSFRIGILRLF